MNGHLTSPFVSVPHCCRAEGRAGHWFGQCFRGFPHVERGGDCGPISYAMWYGMWEEFTTLEANC